MSHQNDQIDAYKAAENRYLELISPQNSQELIPTTNDEEIEHDSMLVGDGTDNVNGGETESVSAEIEIEIQATQQADQHRRQNQSDNMRTYNAPARSRSGVECPLDPSVNNQVVQLTSSDSDDLSEASSGSFLGYDDENENDSNEAIIETGVFGFLRRKSSKVQEETFVSALRTNTLDEASNSLQDRFESVANGTSCDLQETFDSTAIGTSDTLQENIESETDVERLVQQRNSDRGPMSTAMISYEQQVQYELQHHQQMQHHHDSDMHNSFNQSVMDSYIENAGNDDTNATQEVILDEGYTIQTILAANSNQRCIIYDNPVNVDVSNSEAEGELCIVEVPYDSDSMVDEAGIIMQDGMNLQYADDGRGNLCLIDDVGHVGHNQQLALQHSLALVQGIQSNENAIDESVHDLNSSEAAQNQSLFYDIPNVHTAHEVIILSNEVIGVGNPLYFNRNAAEQLLASNRSNEQQQVLCENLYDDDEVVAGNNSNTMLVPANEEDKEVGNQVQGDDILINSEATLTVSTEQEDAEGRFNAMEPHEYDKFYENVNENTNPDINTEEYLGVDEDTEVEMTSNTPFDHDNETPADVDQNLIGEENNSNTDSDVCIILDDKQTEEDLLPPVPKRQKMDSVDCDYKANGLETPVVENETEELQEDTQSVESVIIQANNASCTQPMQVLKCSTSTTTEFPNSSNSNQQQQSTNGEGPTFLLSYPQRTPILKNTLASETLDRKLANLSQFHPQLSVDQKIARWSCNESDVSEVEDVVLFDEYFESREASRREQMMLPSKSSEVQDFHKFREVLKNNLHRIKNSMLQHDDVADKTTLQAKAQRMLQKRQATDTPSSSTADNQQFCVSYQNNLHAAGGGNNTSGNNRPVHRSTLHPRVQETESTATLVPMSTKYMTTNKRRKSCAIAVTRETQTLNSEKQKETQMESIGTSTTDLQPQPRSGTGVYVPMTSTGFGMETNATFTSGINTGFNFNINIPPPPFAKDVTFNNDEADNIIPKGAEERNSLMPVIPADNTVEGNNEALFYKQNEFCNYLGLTGHATANAVAIAMQDLANSSIARRSLRVRNQQKLERMRSDSSHNRKRVSEIKSSTASSRANAGAASSEVLTTSSSAGLNSTTTAIHVPLLSTEEQTCQVATAVNENQSVQNSYKDVRQDIFCLVPANDPKENRKSAAIHDYLFKQFESNNKPSSLPINLNERSHNEQNILKSEKTEVGSSNKIDCQNIDKQKPSPERIHEQIQQRLKEAREAKPTIYIVQAMSNDTNMNAHRSLLAPPPSLGSIKNSREALPEHYINKTKTSATPTEFTEPADQLNNSNYTAANLVSLKQIGQDPFATVAFPVVNDNSQRHHRKKNKKLSLKSSRRNAILAQNEKRRINNMSNPVGLITRSTTTMNSKQLRNRKVSLLKSYCLTNATRSKRLMGGTIPAMDASTSNNNAIIEKTKSTKKSLKTSKKKISKTTQTPSQSDTNLQFVEMKKNKKTHKSPNSKKLIANRSAAGKNTNTKDITTKIVKKIIKKRRMTMQPQRFSAKTVDDIPTNANNNNNNNNKLANEATGIMNIAAANTQNLFSERSFVKPPVPSLATERFLHSVKPPSPALIYPPMSKENNTQERESAGAVVHKKLKAEANLITPSIKRLTMPSVSQRNPLVRKNGKVLYIYFEQDMLIVVQEKLVSFWKYSKILNVLRKSGDNDLRKMQNTKETKDDDNFEIDNNSLLSDSLRDSISSRGSSRKSDANSTNRKHDWIHVGHVRRLTSDIEVMSPYSNRICVNNSTPLYLELRCHPLDHNRREAKLVSTYVNVYYYSEEEMCPKMHSIHLDAVPGESSGILYTTITESRYFVMAWPQETMMGKVRTGLCKYSLTPALDTLASIREFKNMKHTIRHIECLGEDKLIGYGPSRITIWDHRSGDTVMCYDLCMNLGHNLGTMYYPSFDMAQNSMLVLYQHIQEDEDKPAELHIIACEVSCSTPSHRVLKVHKLPSPQFKKDLVAVNTCDHLIIKSKDNEEIWISNDDPQLLTFVSSLGTKNYYCRNSSQVVEMSSTTLNVNSIANHMLKLATRKMSASSSHAKERKK